MPFTLRNLRDDLEDVGARFDGAPDLEFRLATAALGLERSGLGLQRIPPGHRFPYGHTHRTQEEVYVVLHGGGRMKLDDEIVPLRRWDAVRVPPGTWRGYEAGVGLLMVLAGCLWAAYLVPLVHTHRISARHVWLRGVHPGYLSRWPDFPREEH